MLTQPGVRPARFTMRHTTDSPAAGAPFSREGARTPVSAGLSLFVFLFSSATLRTVLALTLVIVITILLPSG